MLELIKQSLKKAMWPVLPKPWETADMEFHHGLWNGVSALYSEGGRQLGEENTRPFALNHHVPAETIDCKYQGSREGRAINISALRIAMQNFDAALAITEAVRSQHLAQMPQAHILGIWDLYIIARSSIALIAYQKRSAHQPAAEPIVSDPLTSQYQFISGVFMICRHMLDSGDDAIAQNRPISGEALYDYADKHGIFISFNGMACAGSTKKIHEFLDFCNEGNGAGSQHAFDLANIIDRPDNWYQYALATIELDCFIEEARVREPTQQPGPRDTTSSKSAQHYAAIADYVSSLMQSPVQPDDVPFRIGALDRQNAILNILGRKPIKSIKEKHVIARLG